MGFAKHARSRHEYSSSLRSQQIGSLCQWYVNTNIFRLPHDGSTQYFIFIGTIAIPHDNRQVVLYDLQGQKIIRLPRDASKSHNLMVTSVCWAASDISESWRCKANLFSAGFDRIALGWTVRPASKDEKEAKLKE